MLTQQRHEVILKLLHEKQTATIQEIADLTLASESTIRRDLTELEKQQKLERVHGGAVLADQQLEEPSVLDKSAKNLQEKIQLAKTAAELIEEGDYIYLDAGTTIIQMIPFLKDRDIQVVTNGLTHVQPLMEYGITTYLTGGLMKARTGALVGVQALNSLQAYQFDKCFLGVNGFHEMAGYTTPDPEEAAMKRLAAAQAQETYVLADYTKYGKVTFSKVIDLHEAGLITAGLPDEVMTALGQQTTIKGGMS
ncbi:DeoR/GlpR family DNA-binding transcription regulator [Planococcus lenghuensis]|uniref:DeoR family transcriptional regulator n=1 Tax=Planococcus lenghuensis TaxID=2213202 RepID=A0A1Q2KZ01_9BACL|nr:DeoR/GlpR family DNA-binding transcription regulator [Planococcus lenghuensis]AQQ53429.1 DeoR family transcriptional regulator [Planococcus lenghuensis]